MDSEKLTQAGARFGTPEGGCDCCRPEERARPRRCAWDLSHPVPCCVDLITRGRDLRRVACRLRARCRCRHRPAGLHALDADALTASPRRCVPALIAFSDSDVAVADRESHTWTVLASALGVEIAELGRV